MQIQNPFEEIINRLSNIEHCLLDLKRRSVTSHPASLPVQSDQCNKMQALEFLNQNGYTISESKLYKLTAKGELPSKSFGRKLIFSRKQLLDWVESQTIDKHNTSHIDIRLAQSANRKKKGGANG